LVMLPCAQWPVERRSCSRGYLGHGGGRDDRSDLDGDGFGVRNGSRGRVGLAVDGSDTGGVNGLSAITADVSSLTAPVAGLASSVKRATVRGRAVTGDVTELAASVALHGLSLAVASKVVGAAALVAASSTATSETTAAASEATSEGSASSTANRGNGSSTGSRAAPGKVARLAARVAAAVGGTTADAKSRAVSLDVTETLAVVALLGLSCPGVRAGVALVARLLAVVAKTLTAGADLGVVANVAALVARTTGEGRHLDIRF